MKTSIGLKIWALILFAGLAGLARGQTTAFTYQGRLNDSGSMATGNYDISFAAYDSLTGGNLVGGIVTNYAVAVSNGLFTTPVDFGGGVFTGLDLWLEITVSTNGANAFSTIAPRLQFTPTPYAQYAPNADYSSYAGYAENVVAGVVAAPQLATASSPSSGQVLAFNGTQLVWQNPVVGGSTGGWSLNGNTGTTGGVNYLGTVDSQPLELKVSGVRGLRLEPNSSSAPNVIGGAPSNHSTNGVVAAVIGGGFNNVVGGDEAFVGGGYQNAASGYIATVAGGAYNTASSNESCVVGGAFNVASGIGSVVVGGGWDGVSAQGNVASGTSSFIGGGLLNSASGPSATAGGGYENLASGADPFGFYVGSGGLRHLVTVTGDSTVAGGYQNIASATGATVPGGGFNVASGDMSFATGFHAVAATAGSFVWADTSTTGTFTSTASNQFLIRATGNVGINTASPTAALHVYNASNSVSDRIESGGAVNSWSRIEFANLDGQWNVGTSRGYNGDQLYFNREGLSGNALALQPDGDAAFGGNVTIAENASVCSLTIRGGCDLAEPFATAERDIEKGAIVVIDPAHPGQLKLSDAPYDTRVAGVVSGANGINPGIAMHQEGAFEGGQNVALSGRVYVQADASNGAIEPGDLLTTSTTPGRAMKATDHQRAQGAILGKAMSRLAGGKGMVLVLVTLQ